MKLALDFERSFLPFFVWLKLSFFETDCDLVAVQRFEFAPFSGSDNLRSNDFE